MYTINSKIPLKKCLATRPTKEIRQNNKKHSVIPKDDRRRGEKGIMNGWDK